MKRFVLATSIFFIWLAIASSYYMCVIKGICGGTGIENQTEVVTQEPPKKTVVKKESINPVVEKIKDTTAIAEENIVSVDSLKSGSLKIYDQDFLLKSYYSNFKIYENKNKVTIPLSISKYGYLVAKHMDSVDSSLIIKGVYNQNETMEKGFERANFIKERLTKLGIPEKLITTNAKAAIYDYQYNKFSGGIEFNFKKSDTAIAINSINYSLSKDSEEILTKIKESDQKNTEKVIAKKINKAIAKEHELQIVSKNKDNTESNIPQIKTESKSFLKVDNASFTVTEKYFKNNKFKTSKRFKKFLKDHKEAKNIQLIGYSNANKNINENYVKGLELINLVSSYLLSEGNFNGEISTRSLKDNNYNLEGNLKEGVTLVIQ